VVPFWVKRVFVFVFVFVFVASREASPEVAFA
jgi:hypothetical protein